MPKPVQSSEPIPAAPHGLSDTYWASLRPEHRALYARVRPLPRATYKVDIHISLMEDFIAGQERDMAEMGGVFELEPDFQRGHVWTDEQRSRYIEALLREMAPTKILFNCPGWERDRGANGDIPMHTMQCIDGLQRLTAVRKFMAGEVRVFDGLVAGDLKGSPFDPGRYRLSISVFEFARRMDLLQFYLDLNSGGSVHSADEIARVRALRDASARS